LNKIGSYEIELVNISPKQWDDFLKNHSNLPGPRANIELAKAFARIGTLMDFKKYMQFGPAEAPANTPDEFLTFCGVLGYGQYLSQYHDSGLMLELKEKANDTRPLIRKAVAMALQIIGRKRMDRLKGYAKNWVDGSYLEQRAAIQAVCDPDLLRDKEVSLLALELLDWVTANMVDRDDQQNGGYEELQKALSDCWSEAVTAFPEKGKPMMERWMKEKHPVVNNIMRENLKKERLFDMDPEWTTSWLHKVSE
jgi:hypothetical protein